MCYPRSHCTSTLLWLSTGTKLNSAIHYRQLLNEMTQDELHIMPTVLITLLSMAQLLPEVCNNIFNPQINDEGYWLIKSHYKAEKHDITWLNVKQHESLKGGGFIILGSQPVRPVGQPFTNLCQGQPIPQSLPKHFNFTLKARSNRLWSEKMIMYSSKYPQLLTLMVLYCPNYWS